jgi:cell division protease FtsH
MGVEHLGQGSVLGRALADVAATRERTRLLRLRRLTIALVLLAVWMGWRQFVQHDPVQPGLPPMLAEMGPMLIIVAMLAAVLLIPLVGAGRSPHVLYRASEIPVGLDDVKGLRPVREEVVKSLNLFLAHKTFQEHMGGTPRRAILFEGPPGTGKTYMAKAMAKEAGVPFLFVSSSAFQSMYYGQTNRKIRSYFRALRQAARAEGGAIGFIEEIDAIGAARTGMGSHNTDGITGVVNELLIQLQSFDEPTRGARAWGAVVDQLNRLLPPHRQLSKPGAKGANVLVVGATNRAADLDPALLRPGRFDRTIHFDLPSRADRREIIDFYLARKAHAAELDDPARRDQLAAMTFGYSPVMLEHLFDEGLVWALRRGADRLDWHDVQQAKMTEELGLKQPVEYTERERRTIATHESGHATVAYLVSKAGADGSGAAKATRKLEVLSIIKRREALGLLAHSDPEERFTSTRSEVYALVLIAMGGMVAEELEFGESGTGPAGDLQSATDIVAHMVGAYGMAGSLVSYEAAAVQGAGNLVAKVLGTKDGREAVDRILQEAKADAEVIVGEHRHILHALRDALLDRDELIDAEILDVIHRAEDEHGAATTSIDLRELPVAD